MNLDTYVDLRPNIYQYTNNLREKVTHDHDHDHERYINIDTKILQKIDLSPDKICNIGADHRTGLATSRRTVNVVFIFNTTILIVNVSTATGTMEHRGILLHI